MTTWNETTDYIIERSVVKHHVEGCTTLPKPLRIRPMATIQISAITAVAIVHILIFTTLTSTRRLLQSQSCLLQQLLHTISRKFVHLHPIQIHRHYVTKSKDGFSDMRDGCRAAANRRKRCWNRRGDRCDVYTPRRRKYAQLVDSQTEIHATAPTVNVRFLIHRETGSSNGLQVCRVVTDMTTQAVHYQSILAYNLPFSRVL